MSKGKKIEFEEPNLPEKENNLEAPEIFHSPDKIEEVILQEEDNYQKSTPIAIRKILSENEWIRNKLDEYANFVLGLLGSQDSQPFLDYAQSNAIGGAVGLGELLFGIIRRQMQDRDFSGAMDSGWDSGMKFTQRDTLCEICKIPIKNPRLGQRVGCNAGGVILEGKTLNGTLENLCPFSKEDQWQGIK